MHSLREVQIEISRAIRWEAAEIAATLLHTDGFEPGQRLQIYRNNHRLGALAALQAVYPVVERLAGGEWFAHTAVRYLADCPSTSGDLQNLGERFPGFLRHTLADTRHAYFADVAALEWAYQCVLTAIERPCVDLAKLRSFAPRDYDRLAFVPRPALRLIASPYPLLAIWRANRPQTAAAADTADAGIRLEGAETQLLVIRRRDHVELRNISAGGAILLCAFIRGLPLGPAAQDAGHPLPRDGSTLDFRRVVHEGSFKSQEQWVDRRGHSFAPEEYFNVGGKTKWYGAALLRYGAHEFRAEPDYHCVGWPISPEELLPYYIEAETLLGVRDFAPEPDLLRITQALVRRSPTWSHQSLPLGLSPRIVDNDLEARHFDGFASAAGLKADAESSFLDKVAGLTNLITFLGRPVAGLIGSPGDPTRIEGVTLAGGVKLRADAVLLAAGALHSPRLLQDYVATSELTGKLPCTAHIGRFLKYHLLTAVIAVSASRKTDLIRKTRLILNADLPHSSVQPLGFDAELIGTLVPGFVPRPVARMVGRHAYGFFLQTEDGAHRDNRVVAASPASGGLPMVDYDAARTPVAAAEHQRLVRGFKGALARTGMIAFSQRVGLAGTAHVSGTLTAGSDPSESVVDSLGRVHGMTGLFVVDGSVLPRSGRVNPSLTIYAWALRTAEHLVRQLQYRNAP